MGKMFGGSKKADLPDPPKPIPLPDEDEIKKNKRREMAKSASMNRGRESTIFSEESLG